REPRNNSRRPSPRPSRRRVRRRATSPTTSTAIRRTRHATWFTSVGRTWPRWKPTSRQPTSKHCWRNCRKWPPARRSPRSFLRRENDDGFQLQPEIPPLSCGSLPLLLFQLLLLKRLLLLDDRRLDQGELCGPQNLRSFKGQLLGIRWQEEM